MTRLLVVLAMGLSCAACSSSGPLSAVPQRQTSSAAERSGVLSPSTPLRTGFVEGPIAHVIFIVQENRSFNNLFLGYPGAKTQNYGYDSGGNKIALHSQSLSEHWDIAHFSPEMFEDCDSQKGLPGTHCKMDGWDKEQTGPGAPKDAPYAYVPRSEITQYWHMAQQYVLADRMFASNLDGSFIAHQYIVAAYASRAVDYPYGAWNCSGGSYDKIPTLTTQRQYGAKILTCMDNPTIASEADTAGVSWRSYTGGINSDGGLWNSYADDKQIYFGPDWTTDVINPPSQFLSDIGAGKLAAITWITPTYELSDHPGVGTLKGPAWVTSLVNAIGESQFWNSCAIFIIWDDWGGWFDPVKPAFADYDGLGFRVPLLMISPYARQGYVTHKQYETASVLRFMEDTFGLPPMAAADARANDPAGDAFDYSQKPRAFKKFRGSEPNSYWIERDRTPAWRGKPRSIIGDD